MKLPDLFRREKPDAGPLPLTTQDRAERLLVESLRFLSQTCSKVADLIETQRLERRGFDPQGKWLERSDPNKPSTPGR